MPNAAEQVGADAIAGALSASTGMAKTIATMLRLI
jgi:hypothetical protein